MALPCAAIRMDVIVFSYPVQLYNNITYNLIPSSILDTRLRSFISLEPFLRKVYRIRIQGLNEALIPRDKVCSE